MLLREALAMTWASKVPSVLLVIVTAAMCFTALATVGRSAAAANDVQQRLEQAGARRLSVVDAKAQGFINDRTLNEIRGINTVQQANALGTPFDAVNGAVGQGGTRIPVWPVIGSVSQVAGTIRGRLPLPGEALISVTMQHALGLAQPVGYLTSADGFWQYPIVGSFTPNELYTDLSAGAIVATAPGQVAREIRVLVDSIPAARPTVTAVLSILSPADSQGVYLESPIALADTARELNIQLAAAGRSLLLLILAVGGFFIIAVVLADVLVRRRDLGRRRTLGIARSDLITLVAGRATLTATLGGLIGCIAGSANNQALGIATPTQFTLAVGTLAVLTAGMAALPPAAYAARLDPVAVMRTP